MKQAVTPVDATEQNRKNRVACSFCMNERRSCDAKTTEVSREYGRFRVENEATFQ